MEQRFNPLAVTAVTSTQTQAYIPTDAHRGFVALTSTGANNIVRLPTNSDVPIGWQTAGWIGATGLEIRLSTSDTAGTLNGVTAVVSTEAAIPATTLIRVTKVASATWIVDMLDEGGDDVTAPVPD